ncbi:MAG: acylphosphatase [Frankiaceae bacterium]
MSAPVRRRVLVRGRVQGVSFRDSCRRRAHAAHLAGTVSNLTDGSVEAIFEGPAESVEELVAWCRRGTRLADVTSVDVSEETPQGLTAFTIS